VGAAVAAGVPPAGEQGDVEVAFAVEDVEVPSRFKGGEGVGDLAVAEGFGGRPVSGVLNAAWRATR
jgi:hypothetical protein